jgi:hypothetical protein
MLEAGKKRPVSSSGLSSKKAHTSQSIAFQFLAFLSLWIVLE